MSVHLGCLLPVVWAACGTPLADPQPVSTAPQEGQHARGLPTPAPVHVLEHLVGDSNMPLAVGDLDGDGQREVVLRSAAAAGGNSVQVYKHVPGGLEATPWWTFTAPAPLTNMGATIDAGCDLNGDGADDLVLAAPKDPTASGNGNIAVFYGPLTAPAAATADLTLTHPLGASSASFGHSLDCHGDINGDGIDDLVVAARTYDASQVLLYRGTPTGLPSVADQMLDVGGTYNAYAVGWAGDLNGDGQHDVMVTDQRADGYPQSAPMPACETPAWVSDTGAARFYPATGGLLATSPEGSLSFDEKRIGDGGAVTGWGDVNGDGYDDVLITSSVFLHDPGGPHWYDPQRNYAGAVLHLLEGGPNGPLQDNGRLISSWSVRSEELAGVLYNSGTNQPLGAALVDVDQDGLDDVVFAHPGSSVLPEWLPSAHHESVAGALFVYAGGPQGLPPNPSRKQIMWGEYGNSDHLVPFDDIDGDGVPELLVWGQQATNDALTPVYGTHMHTGIGPTSAPPPTVSMPTSSAALVPLGDRNGDGRADALLSTTRDDHYSVYYQLRELPGTPVGLAEPSRPASTHPQPFLPYTVPTSSGYTVLHGVDGDGDGNEDMLWSGCSGLHLVHGPLPLIAGNGTSSSVVPAVWDCSDHPVVGDWNGDGLDDLALQPHEAADALQIYTSDASGFAQQHVELAPSLASVPAAWTDRWSVPVNVGDVNGDGGDDLVAAHNGSPIEVVLYAPGAAAAPTMQPLFTLPDPSMYVIPNPHAPFDLNDDGWTDLLISAPESGVGGELYVAFGGAGGPAAPGAPVLVAPADSLGFGQPHRTTHVGDVNGDQHSDIAVMYFDTSGFSPRLTMAIHASTGLTFDPTPLFVVDADLPIAPRPPVPLGDVNGDGLNDLGIALIERTLDYSDGWAVLFGDPTLPTWEPSYTPSPGTPTLSLSTDGSQALELTPFKVFVEVSAPDGAPATLSATWEGQPLPLTWSDDGGLLVTPSDVGTSTLTVTASSASGDEATATLPIDVGDKPPYCVLYDRHGYVQTWSYGSTEWVPWDLEEGVDVRVEPGRASPDLRSGDAPLSYTLSPAASTPDEPLTWSFPQDPDNCLDTETMWLQFHQAGVQTGTLTVTDADGTTQTCTHDFYVEDVPPTFPEPLIASPAAPLEGDLVTFTAPVDEPGAPEGVWWTWDLGFGPAAAVEAQDTTSTTYANPGTYTVAVSADDLDGSGPISQTMALTVGNAIPAVASLVVGPAVEGQPVDATWVLDAREVDPLTLTVDWGDGDVLTTDDATHPTGTTHTFAQPGPYTVTLRVHDDEGSSHVASAAVSVADVAPLISTISLSLSLEGQPSNVSLDGVFGADTTITIDWGDGNQTVLSGDAVDQLPAHTYAQDGTYDVTVTVTDDDGNSATLTETVVVQPVAPTVTALELLHDDGQPVTGPVPEGSPLTATAVFTDVDGDTHTVQWLDADGVVLADGNPATVVFDDEQDATVTAQVTDEGGATGALSAAVTVVNVVPQIVDVPPPEWTEAQAVAWQPTVEEPGADVLNFTLTSSLPVVVDPHTGAFNYSPTYDDALTSPHTFTLTVDDGDGGTHTVEHTVNVTWLDADQDGLPDTWEAATGVSDPTADPDQDGRDNATELALGTDPTVYDGPPAPTLLSPDDGASVANPPTLTWADASPYTAHLVLVDHSGAMLAEHSTEDASWTAPALPENQSITWTVTLADAYIDGPAAQRTAFVDSVPEPPTPPTPLAPLDGDTAEALGLTLTWQPGVDPEGQPVSHTVELTDGASRAVLWSETVTATASPTAAVPLDALDGLTQFAWRVRAEDPDGLASPWTADQQVVLSRVDTAPPVSADTDTDADSAILDEVNAPSAGCRHVPAPVGGALALGLLLGLRRRRASPRATR